MPNLTDFAKPPKPKGLFKKKLFTLKKRRAVKNPVLKLEKEGKKEDLTDPTEA